MTSLTNALQQVVSSLTIAALATILTSRATLHSNAAKTALATSQGHVPAKGALQSALSHAFALAFDDTFRVLVVGALIATGMGFILRRLALQTDEEETEDAGEVRRGAAVNA